MLNKPLINQLLSVKLQLINIILICKWFCNYCVFFVSIIKVQLMLKKLLLLNK